MDTILPSKPDSGFKKICSDALKQMRDGELQLVAASLSFSTVLAIIPFIAVVLATLKFVGGGFELFYPKVQQLFLHNLRETAGAAAARTIRGFLNNISAGKMGATGAIFLIATSFRLLHDMEVGIHRLWNVKNSRLVYKRLLFYWLLILLLPFALALYVSFVSLENVSAVRRLLPRGVSDFGFVWVALVIVYKFVPNLKVNWAPVFISSGLTALVLYVAQKGLTWVTGQLFNYDKIYGSFAAIPVLLIWILTIWYIILGGVAVCASLQKRRKA